MRTARTRGLLSFCIGIVACGWAVSASAEPLSRDQWRPEQAQSSQSHIETLREQLRDLALIMPLPSEIPKDEAIAALLIKKGELVYEIAYYDDLVMRDRWRACRLEARRLGAPPERCREPRPDYEDVLEVYSLFVAHFPDHARLDLALLRLGQSQTRMGRDEEGLGFLEALLRDCPDSVHRHDAHLMVADFWFDRGDRAKARQSYEAVIIHTGSPLLDYALYKLGWIHHLEGDHIAAVRMLEEVLALQKAEPGREAMIKSLDRELEWMRKASPRGNPPANLIPDP